jgi:hypothetical protein
MNKISDACRQQGCSAEQLAGVWKACKAAVPVWLVLSVLAELRGRNRFSVKRSTLGRICGIRRLPTISAALAALQKLSVIRREVRHCRRPDGTLFHRLRIHLKYQISKSVLKALTRDDTSYENRIRKSVRGEPHQSTESVSIHREQNTAYSQSTEPGYEKRSHSPRTPEYEKRNTSRRDGGTRLTHTHTHSAPADAAGARCSTNAATARPAGAERGKALAVRVWNRLTNEMKETIKLVAKQVGCDVFEFHGDLSDLDWMDLGDCENPGDVWLTINKNKIQFWRLNADGEDSTEEEWQASATQLKDLWASIEREMASRTKPSSPHDA